MGLMPPVRRVVHGDVDARLPFAHCSMMLADGAGVVIRCGWGESGRIDVSAASALWWWQCCSVLLLYLMRLVVLLLLMCCCYLYGTSNFDM